jgi:hypothetical protein
VHTQAAQRRATEASGARLAALQDQLHATFKREQQRVERLQRREKEAQGMGVSLHSLHPALTAI